METNDGTGPKTNEESPLGTIPSASTMFPQVDYGTLERAALEQWVRRQFPAHVEIEKIEYCAGGFVRVTTTTMIREVLLNWKLFM